MKCCHPRRDDRRPHPETVEAIRRQLDPRNAALVSVLAYEGKAGGGLRARARGALRRARTSAHRSARVPELPRRPSASPQLAASGLDPRATVPYFRSYDLRHTGATLLLHEGRTLNEVAEHLGHADPGFTARTYAHVMRDAPRRRRITVKRSARAVSPPVVDPCRPVSRQAWETCRPLREEVPANRRSRRPDSNRGPLHYE